MREYMLGAYEIPESLLGSWPKASVVFFNAGYIEPFSLATLSSSVHCFLLCWYWPFVNRRHYR